MYVDPDGEWINLVIAGVVGGFVNMAINADKIDEFWSVEGALYFNAGASSAIAGQLIPGVDGALGGVLNAAINASMQAGTNAAVDTYLEGGDLQDMYEAAMFEGTVSGLVASATSLAGYGLGYGIDLIGSIKVNSPVSAGKEELSVVLCDRYGWGDALSFEIAEFSMAAFSNASAMGASTFLAQQNKWVSISSINIQNVPQNTYDNCASACAESLTYFFPGSRISQNKYASIYGSPADFIDLFSNEFKYNNYWTSPMNPSYPQITEIQNALNNSYPLVSAINTPQGKHTIIIRSLELNKSLNVFRLGIMDPGGNLQHILYRNFTNDHIITMQIFGR